MPTTTGASSKRANCLDCQHYHISHDVRFPYACRALNIKSKRQPCQDVLEASGRPCLYRQQKTAPKP